MVLGGGMGQVAVIGLGGMGRAIARTLVRTGHEVTVWNRSPGPVDELAAAGARPAADLADALASPVVLSVLADDAAFDDVFLTSGAVSHLPAGGVHANLSTVSPALARRAAQQHADHAVGYVAAPVFGRVAVAEAGNLNVVAAGSDADLDRMQQYFDVIGARTWRMGSDPAQANTTKILGNYLIACAIQALGEAVSLGEEADVDPGVFVQLMAATLFPGPVYSGYGTMIAERRYQPAGFSVVLGRKDVRLALDAAAEAGIPLPTGELLGNIFDQAIREGRADDDWAAIAELQPRG
ncbi:NAD(P)-dependent oxidoreductase [Rathayibacter sp. CAU 1779]